MKCDSPLNVNSISFIYIYMFHSYLLMDKILTIPICRRFVKIAI